MVESLLKEFPNVLTLRVRMPIVADLTYPRNFITKIIKYEKVISTAWGDIAWGACCLHAVSDGQRAAAFIIVPIFVGGQHSQLHDGVARAAALRYRDGAGFSKQISHPSASTCLTMALQGGSPSSGRCAQASWCTGTVCKGTLLAVCLCFYTG
jgi:hypothetical protein